MEPFCTAIYRNDISCFNLTRNPIFSTCIINVSYLLYYSVLDICNVIWIYKCLPTITPPLVYLFLRRNNQKYLDHLIRLWIILELFCTRSFEKEYCLNNCSSFPNRLFLFLPLNFKFWYSCDFQNILLFSKMNNYSYLRRNDID